MTGLYARMIRKALYSLAALGALPLAALAQSGQNPPPAQSGWALLNMPEGVTVLSRKIYGLHMLIFWVCVAIAVVVFAAMIYAMVRFRRSKGAVADTTLTHSTRVEVAWTIVPVAILVAMAVPAARTLIDIEDTRNTELTIKITGYQWKWQYEYLDAGVGYFSNLDRRSNAARQLVSGIDPASVPNYLLDVDRPLVIPAGKKVRFLVTAQDVIHAWWVPEFGMKKDAIPGFVNEMWVQVEPDRTGIYRGQCTELCGRDHAYMPIVVEVLSPPGFEAWLEARRAEQQQAAAPEPPAEPAAAPSDPQAAQAPAAVARGAATRAAGAG